MKKTILTIAAALVCTASILTSCAGFLEENPTTALSESSVYINEDALEAQMFGIYQIYNGGEMYLGRMYEFFQCGSGLIAWKGNRTTDNWLSQQYFCKYSNASNSNYTMFQAICSGINRCNRLIDNLPGSPVNDTFKKEIEGEARFHRANLFFLGVRIWGDFPLMLTSPKSVKEVNNPRTAWYKVYNQIIKDLEFAETNMCTMSDLKGKYYDTRYSKGRICRTAATALKASVYITLGSMLSSPDDNFWDSSKDAALIAEGKDPRTPDFSPIGISSPADAYQKAYDAADYVIRSGDYALVDNYYKLFTWGWRPAGVQDDGSDWFLPERIFCVQSTDATGTNYYSIYSLPQQVPWTSCATTSNSNWGRFRPDRYFINEFLRRTGGELGTGAENSDFYVKTQDPRFDASFFCSFKKMSAIDHSYDSPTGSSVNTYPKTTFTVDNTSNTNNTYYMPYSRKAADPTFNVTKGYADMYIIRFAEMYLIRAEAAANLSGGPGDAKWQQALDDVEELHARARKSYDPRTASGPTVGIEYPTWKYETFATKADLVNAIIWERLFELNFENHEWFDTHRFGATWLRDNISIPKNAFAHEPHQEMVYNYIYHLESDPKVHPEDITAIRRGLLNAYPETELRVNTVLDVLKDQNDFYWQ